MDKYHLKYENLSIDLIVKLKCNYDNILSI